MLKVGDKAVVLNDDGGHFYKGKHVIIVRVLSNVHSKPILTKSEHGQTQSWYAEKDLQKIEG